MPKKVVVPAAAPKPAEKEEAPKEEAEKEAAPKVEAPKKEAPKKSPYIALRPKVRKFPYSEGDVEPIYTVEKKF